MGALAVKQAAVDGPKPATVEGQKLAEADAAAQAQLYRDHAPAVMRRLVHACGDTELARDLTQEAFITAFERLSTFRGDAKVSTWLHAIAFNHLRDRRKRLGRERSLWDRLRRQPLALAASVVDAAEVREDLDHLQSALGTLAPKFRDAFVLRIIEQLSLQEAADILGASVATVSHRTRRAQALVQAAFANLADAQDSK